MSFPYCLYISFLLISCACRIDPLDTRLLGILGTRILSYLLFPCIRLDAYLDLCYRFSLLSRCLALTVASPAPGLSSMFDMFRLDLACVSSYSYCQNVYL